MNHFRAILSVCSSGLVVVVVVIALQHLPRKDLKGWWGTGLNGAMESSSQTHMKHLLILLTLS